MAKRERLHVIRDILNVIKAKDGKIKPTHILYKANLSHRMMNEYIDELILRGLILQQNTKKGKTYSMTEKGFGFLKKYGQMTEFMDSFGLGQE